MNDGFNVFKIWLGLKLHFTTETYDWFKYDGRVNCKLETFTKRNDRYFFYKLGTKYNEKEIINYFVANFLTLSWYSSTAPFASALIIFSLLAALLIR